MRQIYLELGNAAFEVAMLESLERKYRLEPSPAVRNAHRAAERRLHLANVRIADHGDPEEQSAIGSLGNDVRTYVLATQRMFAAVDAHDAPRVLAIDHRSVDPVFERIEKTISTLKRRRRDINQGAWDDMQYLQKRVFRASVVFACMGLAFFVLFMIMTLAARRALIERHLREIRRLEAASVVDGLTQLGNHRAFKDDLRAACDRAMKTNEPLTLAMIDVDEFKIINDENGHVHGDRVLFDLATLLRGGRSGDRAYRVGGDEFAIILPQTTSEHGAVVLERLRVAAPGLLAGGTISIGHATAMRENVSPESITAWADSALYRTKRSGRNGVTAFDAVMHASLLVSTERVKQLRAMIADGLITTAYQPIWNTASGTILGYEALARPDERSGFASPQDAFDLAERIGFASELDKICHRVALSSVRSLPDDASLFINMSPQTLEFTLDITAFCDIVARAGLVPERIVIEITERAAARLDAVVANAELLIAKGFRLALDDTGAGHAGLEIMSRLHFDYVKIDRTIIVNARTDCNAAGVIAAILAFAQTSGSFVIAEGIEDASMLAFVSSLGGETGVKSDGVQGYFLGRPSRELLDDAARDVIAKQLRDASDTPTLFDDASFSEHVESSTIVSN